MLTWTIKLGDQKESIKKWKAEGDNSPEGIQLISHYWNVNHLGGWAVFESKGHSTIAR